MLAKQRSVSRIKMQTGEITQEEDAIDPEYLHPELADHHFEQDDPNQAAPLPLVPTKWQTASGGPSVEVNLFLVAQMGLINSCLVVFGRGAAMKHEVHVIAGFVLLLVIVGDLAFFRFLRGTVDRLEREGALEYVPTDHVFDTNRHIRQRGAKQLFRHDEEGKVCRDTLGRKLHAKMDAHMYPAVACEFVVHADQYNNAVYYEHDAEGNPIRVGDALVLAVPDAEGHFPLSSKPVPINLEQPEAQNAAEIAYADESFCDRVYLFCRYNDKTTGIWQGNTDEAKSFIEGYGSAFAKFGAFGYLYYFVELSRKLLDCCVLGFARGSTQTGVITLTHWLFSIAFVYIMPCACGTVRVMELLSYLVVSSCPYHY